MTTEHQDVIELNIPRWLMIALGAIAFAGIAAFMWSHKDNPDFRNQSIRICTNVSTAPVEAFCNDLDMKQYVPHSLFGPNVVQCSDFQGEVHSYSVSNNGSTWFIGNRSYAAVFSCEGAS